MKLTTRKLIDGSYSIEGTNLIVERGDPPKFGLPQEWEICLADDREFPLLTAKGKARALEALELLLQACAPAQIVVSADNLTGELLEAIKSSPAGRVSVVPTIDVAAVEAWASGASVAELERAALAIKARVAGVAAELEGASFQ
jgi:hypothetical protein